MIRPRFVLFSALLLQFAYEAYAMKCELALGVEMSCPTVFNDDDKVFCCHSENVPYCCDLGDYIKNNSAIIAGILVGAAILLIVIILCCCCFCSCCLLAKRRTNRGTVLYAPVARDPVVPSNVPPPAYVSSPYPLQPALMVHAPPPSQYPQPYPHVSNQPPVNPDYKG